MEPAGEPGPPAWGAAWEAMWESLTLRGGFNTNVVVVGTTLLGLAAGMVGVFALLRKRSLVSDALSHATLPGIVAAFLAAPTLGLAGKSLPVLLAGAATSGVLGILCVQGLLRWTRLREDAAIGVVLSVFFGAGVVGLSYVQAEAGGSSAGLNKFIYGQTAAMRLSDAVLMGALALLAVVIALALLKELALVSFNDAFARVAGWPVGTLDVGMMALLVLVTVAGIQAVGIILVVALLVIPAVSARFWTDRLRTLVVLSGGLGALSGLLGSAVSASMPRQPAGAIIVLVAGVIFVVSLVLAPSRGVLAASVRLGRVRLRIEGDHLLEGGYLASRWGSPRLAGGGRPGRRAALWTLRWRGLVRRAGGGLELTPAGVERGARVARNHALWEQYLVSHADVAPSHVDWSVDQVEHVLSEDLVRRLEAALPPGASGGGSPA